MFNLDWKRIMASGDAETIWNAICEFVKRKIPGASLQPGTPALPGAPEWLKSASHDSSLQETGLSLQEMRSEITQETFLRVIMAREPIDLAASSYTSEQIENELILTELKSVLTCRLNISNAEQTLEHSESERHSLEKRPQQLDSRQDSVKKRAEQSQSRPSSARKIRSDGATA